MTGHYRATFTLFLALTLGIAIWYAATGQRANSFVESQQLLAPGASSDDWFGESIDYDGLTLVVGARKANGVSPESGAAYVYEVDRLTGRYSPVARLDAPVGGSRSWYGFHVAVSGDTIAVGAPWHGPDDSRIGKVYIYERDHRGPEYGAWRPRFSPQVQPRETGLETPLN